LTFVANVANGFCATRWGVASLHISISVRIDGGLASWICWLAGDTSRYGELTAG